LEFRQDFWHKKLESLGYHMVLFVWYSARLWWTDRWTDRWTDIWRQHIPC